MGRLMIRCPVTGREISSGIEADRSRFRASAVFFARSYCEFCRVEHEWLNTESIDGRYPRSLKTLDRR